MTLGEKLQTLRRSRGLSQEQLAEILEVSRQAVSKWENGDSAPDLDRIRAICTYFGVTTDYLIWDEPEDAPRGAEKARSRETQRKPLRETVGSTANGRATRSPSSARRCFCARCRA